jgi:hypothetical protein
VVRDGKNPTANPTFALSHSTELTWTLSNRKSAFTHDQYRLSKKLQLPSTNRFFITPLFYEGATDVTLNATLTSGSIQLPAGTCLLVVRYAQEGDTVFQVRLQLLDSAPEDPILMYQSDRARLELTEVHIQLNALFEPFRLQFRAQVSDSIRHQGRRFLTQVVFAGMQLRHT